MIGQQTQPLELRYHRLEVFNRWLLALALIALVALGGLVAWTAIDRLGVPDGEQLAQDVVAAWTADSSTALEAVYAEDAVFVSTGGTTYEGINSIKGLYAAVKANDFTPEIIGPVVQSGRTVVIPFHLTFSDGTDMYVTSIYELNSAGLVTHHQDYGTP